MQRSSSAGFPDKSKVFRTGSLLNVSSAILLIWVVPETSTFSSPGSCSRTCLSISVRLFSPQGTAHRARSGPEKHRAPLDVCGFFCIYRATKLPSCIERPIVYHVNLVVKQGNVLKVDQRRYDNWIQKSEPVALQTKVGKSGQSNQGLRWETALVRSPPRTVPPGSPSSPRNASGSME